MSEWLEWLRQSDLDYAPGNVCFVFSSGPIAVNPTPTQLFILVDNNNVPLDDGGTNEFLAQ